MRTIDQHDELPDIEEMVESMRAGGITTAEAMEDGITERIFEDWDCHLHIDVVREYVLREARRILALPPNP
jgi:hypothetical protein